MIKMQFMPKTLFVNRSVRERAGCWLMICGLTQAANPLRESFTQLGQILSPRDVPEDVLETYFNYLAQHDSWSYTLLNNKTPGLGGAGCSYTPSLEGWCGMIEALCSRSGYDYGYADAQSIADEFSRKIEGGEPDLCFVASWKCLLIARFDREPARLEYSDGIS
jgi:hypothetical protein